MEPIQKQMPGLLSIFDDPWGINWRIKNALKRLSVGQACKFAKNYAVPPEYDRPVFILGAPRSGTTLLFHLLRASTLGALQYEGNDMWRTYHHPRSNGWRSDAVGAGEVGLGEKRFIHAYLASHFNAERFVQKSPDNCLRVPYLLELFPDAIFVIIKRNPLDVINSLINAWRHPDGLFRSYYLPVDLQIPDYSHRRRWCFCLIEGWRNYINSPIAEIAFEQWRQCVAGIEESRLLVPQSRWHEVYFEEFLADPQEATQQICEAIDIPFDSLIRDKLSQSVANPVNALSPHINDKWRRDNESEIRRLLPRIAEAAAVSGYQIGADSGLSSISRAANEGSTRQLVR